MEKLTLAFDIEGTLLDKKGKLFPQVLDIFRKADFSKTNFALLTGGNYKVALETIKQINENLEKDEFRPWVAVNGGAQIYNPNGELVVDKSLSAETLDKAITTAKGIDENAIFMYATTEDNFVESQKTLFNNTAMAFYKRKDAKKGCSGLSLIDVEGTNSGRKVEEILDEIGSVKGLYVVSLSGEKRAKVFNELSKSLDGEASVFGGKYMAVNPSTKLDALRYILANGRSMPKNIEDVVYFGDGLNDVECLSTCNISVARGKDACAEAVAAAKFSIDDLSNFADALYSGAYNSMQIEPAIEK